MKMEPTPTKSSWEKKFCTRKGGRTVQRTICDRPGSPPRPGRTRCRLAAPNPLEALDDRALPAGGPGASASVVAISPDGHSIERRIGAPRPGQSRLENLGKYELIRKLAVGRHGRGLPRQVRRADGLRRRGAEADPPPPRGRPALRGDVPAARPASPRELNHPNIVQIFDFGEAEGRYFIAMEYVDGPNLRTLVKRARPKPARPIPLARSRLIPRLRGPGLRPRLRATRRPGSRWTSSTATSRPDNILISRNGAVKVVDFGIAKASPPRATTPRPGC